MIARPPKKCLSINGYFWSAWCEHQVFLFNPGWLTHSLQKKAEMKKRNRNLEKKLYNPPLLGLLSVVSIIYFLYYLWWRATATINPNALVFSWALLLAEAFGVLSYILFASMTKDITPKYPYRPPKRGKKVDIFVPTYNEDLEILEATLIGCNRIAYPHETYVLDDGKRAEVEQLALHYACHYIIRSTNVYAKAGNINHALQYTQGEFIVVLDADMVPQPDFLDRTLGYFENEKLAFIQMPQEFYNQDSIQHDQKALYWHEQSLFYRVIQPGKNYSNSAFWCGSPSIVRRKALEDVGGVATETITEDIHTSVRLHSHGWESLFLNETLAYGIAPQTIKAFLLQRIRWAQGTMQLYRSSDSPLWIPGLSLRQRLSYLSSFLAYFESFQKLILILTPVFILMFNVFPMRVEVMDFIFRWIPYFMLIVIANKIGGRGYFRYFQTEKYNILKMIIFIQSTLIFFRKKPLLFKVTPKSVDNSVYTEERRAMRTFMAIFGVITGAILYGFYKILGWQIVNLEGEAFLFALFWALYNAYLIFVGILEVLQKQHERKHYRFPVTLKGALIPQGEAHQSTALSVQLENISITGASLILETRYFGKDSRFFLRFYTPSRKSILLNLDQIQYKRRDRAGRYHAGVSFANNAGINREHLFEYLFIDLPRSYAVQVYQNTIYSTSLGLPLASIHETALSNAPVS
jgi:cellulose synthase (UDP-forming)